MNMVQKNRGIRFRRLAIGSPTKLGFTMVETIISAAITLMVLGSAMGVMMYGLRTWRAEAINSELHQDLEIAMERIRHDLRLSSVGVGLMAFYPANAAEYTAISFPLSTPTAAGLLRRDLDTNSVNFGRIIWDQTIVYHVRPGSPDELLRTVFEPRNTNATPAQLYTQLQQVVLATDTAGLQSAAMTGESVTSRVVFQNLVTMHIRPPDMQFDGYAPAYHRARELNWGSVVLQPGTNNLTFKVAGKHPDSTGYKVGIDWFSLSASASRREGEIYVNQNSHPVSPFYQFTFNNGTVTANDMSAYGANWSGNCQLTFNAAGANAEITFKVFNDLWCDTQFDSPPGVLASNASSKFDYSFTSQNPFIPDFVVSMDSGTTWAAASCTDGAVGSLNLAGGTIVTNFIYGATTNAPGDIMLNGARARFNFHAATNGQLFIDNVKVRREGGASHNLSFGGNTHKKIDANANEWSDFLNIEIDRNASYLVSFEMKTDAGVLSNAKTWEHSDPSRPMSTAGGVADQRLIGLGAIDVRYPSNAVYRSGIFDTRQSSPTYRQINWTQVKPSNTDLDIRVRTGNLRDMSDDPPWEPVGYFQNNTGNHIASLSGGRYVQYEALFTASGVHTQTAILRDVTIDWTPPAGLADLVVGFARGPDYGIIEASVNGQSFIKGIEVEMEIFKDGPYGTNRVAGLMEVRPLNTGR